MNTSGLITSILLMIGIMVSPADVGGGLFWTLVFCLLTFALSRSSGKGWGWKKSSCVVVVALVMALFSCITYQGIPIVQDMPVEGAMGIAGSIYPIWVSVSSTTKKFLRDVGLALIRRK